MTELISKWKVVDMLTSLENEFQHFKPFEGFEHAMYRKLCEVEIEIGKMQSVPMPQWIPVTERLPEHGQEVIVYSGNVLKPTVFAYQFWNPKYDSWKHITHWMPLPEPPKEDA